MADPVTYTFYGTTIPVLRNICKSAISIFKSVQSEHSSAEAGKFPSEEEILATHFGDMLPLSVQPVLLARFPLCAITHLSLSSASPPSTSTEFKSFADIISFFEQMIAVYDGIDEQKCNAAAEKSVAVPFEKLGKTLTMSGMADYYHGFVVPHDYFHLNAIYLLLRSKGFKLGKGVYIGSFQTEQGKKDWAPLYAK